jgi:teichoic acid transport system permease protein
MWAFIQPTVTIAVYWFVFGVGLKSPPTGGVPFILYLITGIIVWFFFSESLVNGTNCFREYSYLVKKVTFNIKILPTVKIISSLYTHIFFIGFALVMLFIYGHSLTPHFLQIGYYLFCLIVFLTGVTWITASLQPFFTDILQFINVGMQVLFWGTPIVVPVETYPENLLYCSGISGKLFWNRLVLGTSSHDSILLGIFICIAINRNCSLSKIKTAFC